MNNPFLQAVIAHPDDDLTRLVYADWLDENGQSERSEFIRVQVALAAGEPDIKRRHHLEDRQRKLLVAHDQEWVRELADVLECPPGKWGGWVFRRGFVEYFRLPAAVLVAHGERLAELTPIRELYLTPVGHGDVEWLCDEPWFARVRDLYLFCSNRGLDVPGAWALLVSSYTAGLRKLVVELNAEVNADADLLARFEAQFRGIWQG